MTMNSEGFLADILAEPNCLDALADRATRVFSELPLDGIRRLIFLGMGSSRYAARSAAAALQASGVDAVAAYASSGALPEADRETLVVAISASGGSIETLEALARYRGACRTAFLTNKPDAVCGLADVVIPMQCGPEPGGISCRTFQATVGLLQLMAQTLVGSGDVVAHLRTAASSQRALFDSRSSWLEQTADLLDGPAVYVIGPAERIASVDQSSLMLREGPRLVSAGCETGDWSHVDVYLSKHGEYRALLLPGSRYQAEVLRWAHEPGRECTLVSVGSPIAGAAACVRFPDVNNAAVAALVETSVTELIAWELWRRQA